MCMGRQFVNVAYRSNHYQPLSLAGQTRQRKQWPPPLLELKSAACTVCVKRVEAADEQLARSEEKPVADPHTPRL